jgi:tetratricopeptide (TPR) repeat protein
MLRRLYEEAQSRRQREYGSADARTAQAARDLGLFLYSAGDKAGARRAIADAVRIDEKVFGAASPETLEDVATLASVSPPAEAEPLLRRAIESPDATVAGPALTSLAELRKAAGDRAGAAAFFRKALEKAEIVDGKDGATVALVLNMLAPLVEPKEGVLLLSRALAIDKAALGPSHPQTLRDVRKLAGLLRETGRTSEARELERQFKAGTSH